MTEAAYQAYRKLMQKANYLRGHITAAEGNVAKWTKIEAANRERMQPAMADGAKKNLDKAVEKLRQAKMKFAAFSFPDCNMPDAPPKPNTCSICGNLVAQGDDCANCEV